ncbi:MAG TPA: DUF697 domain-containing protein [Balneolales bacterium]|nr:DUF697 domain-containing protein [Balneolales bacterium]
MSKDKVKTTKVRKLITKASAQAAGIGALPIPGSDTVRLKTIQMKLAEEIGRIHGKVLSKDEILHLMAIFIIGGVGIKAARYGIDAIKAAGWIPADQIAEVCACLVSASIAGTLTYMFGLACDQYYRQDLAMD